MRNRREFGVLALAAIAAAGSTSAVAQTASWPSRPIQLVVPVSAGGGLDLIARLVAKQLSEQTGGTVLVINRGGASGTIAAAAVARATPDGTTLLFQSVSTAVAVPLLMKKLPYDPVKDLAAVSLVARFPLVMVTSPELPVKNLREFIDLLKENPGKYRYGSTGVGTSLYLAGELFKSRTKTDITMVSYKGTADVLPDLMTGRVAMLIDGLPPQLDFIKSGRVRAMAVTSSSRTELLPDVPAMNEIVPGYEMPFWTGIFAPAQTPRPLIDLFSNELSKAMKDPGLVRRLKELGSESVGSSAAELDQYWQQQLEYYGAFVREAGIKIE